MENNPRFQSLRAARDFENLRKNGRYFHPTRWLMVNYQYPEGTSEVRCGWTISRTIAPAVIRNRLRRWGREFFRDWARQNRRRPVDFNLIFRKQDADFYRRLQHTEFNSVLQKVVNRFENKAS